MIYNADEFSRQSSSTIDYWPRSQHPDFDKGHGAWVLSRPKDGSSWWNRLKPAWLVLTGKADTLSWTGQ